MCYNMHHVAARKGNNMNNKMFLGGAIALSLTFAVKDANGIQTNFT